MSDEPLPEIVKTEKPTSYFMALVHIFKGNIGPGLFAMGYAFKNGGFIVSSILTIVIAIVCVHCEHILVRCSTKMRQISNAPEFPDFADTVEQCFANGPEHCKKMSRAMKGACNIFICVTQLGFCCVYFVFIATNVTQLVVAHSNKSLDLRLVMVAALLPIWLSSLVTNLKYLTPISGVASVCMLVGLLGTIVISLKYGNLNMHDRHVATNGAGLALYFGTTIFAFEGIALVLPIKNSMKNPRDFERILGVLNVGMFIVTACFMAAGIIGYAAWGKDTAGSLTLNLGRSIPAEIMKVLVSVGVLFGYPLQLHVAVQIMLPSIIHCTHAYHHQLTANLVFRSCVVLITLAIAVLVPFLGLFISLIGSLCSTALALVFPPIIDLLVHRGENKLIVALVFTKDILIIIVALCGFAIGTYQSVYDIVQEFRHFHSSKI